MHNWLIRNLSLLAFLLLLIVLAYAALTLALVLPQLLGPLAGSAGFGDLLWGGLAGLLMILVYLVAIAIVYGLFLRFLALCDDIAAVRRHLTGKPASLD